ncbi:hypothetical protein ACLB2K_020777 [Fragaria x ananassa]
MARGKKPPSSEPRTEVGQVDASVGEGGVASATASVGEGGLASVAASVGEDGDDLAQSGTKRTSHVWEHFKEYEKIERVKDVEGKIIEIVHRMAHCIYCPKGKIGDFSVESKSDTSGLLRYINQNCRYFPREVEKSQKNLAGDMSRSNKLSMVAYNQTDYLESCVEMIVIDELPFNFVEKKGFRGFCKKVCPLFDVPSRRKLCTAFLGMYDTQKRDLKKMLRIGLAFCPEITVPTANRAVPSESVTDVSGRYYRTAYKMGRQRIRMTGSALGRQGRQPQGRQALQGRQVAAQVIGQ